PGGAAGPEPVFLTKPTNLMRGIMSCDQIVRVPLDELVKLIARIFETHGASRAVAEVIAGNMARAQRDGADSHGVFRLPGYLSTLASGWVDGQATPVVTDAAPSVVNVDA